MPATSGRISLELRPRRQRAATIVGTMPAHHATTTKWEGAAMSSSITSAVCIATAMRQWDRTDCGSVRVGSNDFALSDKAAAEADHG